MVLKQRHYNGGDCWGHTAVLISVVLSQLRRLPLLQVVSNNKSFSVGVQSPTEINAPRECAVILRRICQLSLTRITHQVSRAFDLKRKGTGYMEELKILLEECVCEKLIHMTASGARDKDGISKVRIRPVLQKGSLMFQSAARKGKQEFHSNRDRDELIGDVLKFMEEDFRQLQIQMQDELITVLISKKRKVTIKRKKSVTKLDAPVLMHNRRKHYILEEGIPVPFLIDLGVQTAEGRIVHARYDKFRQINRFLEFVQDVLPQMEKGRELTILDFGCGKSYLTFALYYYLKILNGYDIRVIGLDLKEDVIAHCNVLAEKYRYDKLTFLTGDIADYEGVSKVDMVVTLHACDTATDYALEKALEWDAKVILSVPCCQHELNKQMENEILKPVMKYGLIKERMAALVTDALRAGRLEEAGYQVQILEFVDMEHTPKNILIRAVKTGKPHKIEELDVCEKFLGVDPLLGRLRKGECR